MVMWAKTANRLPKKWSENFGLIFWNWWISFAVDNIYSLASSERCSFYRKLAPRTAGTGIFPAHQFLLKMLFKNMKAFSVETYFSKFKVFWLFWRKQLRCKKKTFSRNNATWYAFCSKFVIFTFPILKKNGLFSRKKPNSVRIWKSLLFHSHSTANLLQFGDKISNSESSGHFKFQTGEST